MLGLSILRQLLRLCWGCLHFSRTWRIYWAFHQLSCEPWGHAYHSGGGCECLSSDRTGAHVHGLSSMTKECLPVSELEDVSVSTGGSGAWISHVARGGRDRCHLCLINQACMAACSWLCVCGGRWACWWHLIGSAP